MDLPIESQSIDEAIPTDNSCDNTNFTLPIDNSSTEDTNDSELTSSKIETQSKEDDVEEATYLDAEMDEFTSTALTRSDSPASEDLEIEKIMAQLENTIRDDVFSKSREFNRHIEVDPSKNRDSCSENLDELNLLNEDIIDYIDSEISHQNENNEVDNCSSNSENTKDKSDGKRDIIDLINDELEETLQFTNVLCHYVYSDVIVGKDFFRLFCSESIKTNIE